MNRKNHLKVALPKKYNQNPQSVALNDAKYFALGESQRVYNPHLQNQLQKQGPDLYQYMQALFAQE